VLDLKRPIREADIRTTGGMSERARDRSRDGYDPLKVATRGKITLISVNSPGCESTSITPRAALQ
jgi:hypothetical protein